eukprot:m.267204 g.267204  ORF g.267204 m.267204 type:complete len:364 (+) comp15634_c5_seq15:908-1999(+)
MASLNTNSGPGRCVSPVLGRNNTHDRHRQDRAHVPQCHDVGPIPRRLSSRTGSLLSMLGGDGKWTGLPLQALDPAAQEGPGFSNPREADILYRRRSSFLLGFQDNIQHSSTLNDSSQRPSAPSPFSVPRSDSTAQLILTANPPALIGATEEEVDSACASPPPPPLLQSSSPSSSPSASRETDNASPTSFSPIRRRQSGFKSRRRASITPQVDTISEGQARVKRPAANKPTPLRAQVPVQFGDGTCDDAGAVAGDECELLLGLDVASDDLNVDGMDDVDDVDGMNDATVPSDVMAVDHDVSAAHQGAALASPASLTCPEPKRAKGTRECDQFADETQFSQGQGPWLVTGLVVAAVAVGLLWRTR